MGLGHPYHSSAGVDGFEWTAWERLNLLEQTIIYGESLPCIQKQKHYDGRWRSACQTFGMDYKDLISMIKEPHAWPSFVTELERTSTLQICFAEFKIIHIPRAQNQISDSLAMTTRTFHRELCFIGCSIPVWLPRSPQV
uniref:RNase H type-1 domain-containing protein n=1 Tax=Brassica oleracea TaxID=3712 RepID=A0A3P6FC15_BRAOL|nr:unnamed protein product [Brassica oleracea]